MFNSALFALAAFAVVPRAFATVFMTSPTASTTCQGGQTCQIAWNEDKDNTPPLLAAWGTVSVGVWVGSQISQTELQRIQDGVNVATTGAIQFKVDPSIGPNGNAYFIRFTADSVKEQGTNFPLEAFSSKFTLSGMSGTFNSTVQAQINGASTAPITAQPTATGTTSSTSSRASSTGTAKTNSTGTAAGASKTGAAVPRAVVNAGAVAAVGALFALAL